MGWDGTTTTQLRREKSVLAKKSFKIYSFTMKNDNILYIHVHSLSLSKNMLFSSMIFSGYQGLSEIRHLTARVWFVGKIKNP